MIQYSHYLFCMMKPNVSPLKDARVILSNNNKSIISGKLPGSGQHRGPVVLCGQCSLKQLPGQEILCQVPQQPLVL